MASEEFKFSDEFLIGTGSSAYQIEGAWQADDKSPSIWDHYFHNKKILPKNAILKLTEEKEKFNDFHKGIVIDQIDLSDPSQFLNGDIACDSYNKLEEDIKNLVDLKVNTYRFSISWPRVLPNGDDRKVNDAGVKYYQSLIQNLLDNNITPVVTMYHWDLPNCLQDLGGWANPNIIEYFVNYACFLFKTFGSQVKIWTTINEPRLVAHAYGSENMAPSVGELFNGIADYMVVRNLLLAHGSVYKKYKVEYYPQQQGEISSLCFDTAWYFPETNTDEDKKAAKRARDFDLGMFIQPLIDGTFPQAVIDGINNTNNTENIKFKRFIEFSEKEKEIVKNTYDFIAFNYYDSQIIRAMTDDEYKNENYLVNKDMRVKSNRKSEKNKENTFKGFTAVVKWLDEKFKNKKLFVAENGFSEEPKIDQSDKKIEYHHGILTEIKNAIGSGIVFKGYCVWSFMDSLEWTRGYAR
uniref:Lactase-phlorizin hydrolase n=1 Tax=Melanaphis sacchari TaxID=742174 RepID=A0A2H8TJA5_9HEMI